MNELKIFKTEELIDEILIDIDKFLNEGNSPYEFVNELINGGFDHKYFKDSQLLVDPKKRLFPSFEKSNDELDCAIRLFESLNLTEEKANDTRLWTYACLKIYPKYIVNRNNIDSTLNKDLLFRYFFYKGGSATTNVLNTISKLWWSVNQTYDKNQVDPYKYTRLLYKGKYKQLFQDITQRPLIFSNKKVVQAYVLFMENKTNNVSRFIAPLLLSHLKSFNLFYNSIEEILELLENFLDDLRKKGMI